MIVSQLQLDGLSLISSDYSFTASNFFDMDKDIVLSDMLTDGEVFARSKIKAKTIVINGIIRSFNPDKIYALNKALAQSGMKTLSVNVKGIGILTAQGEISSRATGSNMRVVSFLFTMPDPYFYGAAQSVQLANEGIARLVLRVRLPFTLGGAANATEIGNMGNSIAYPFITIVGTLTNPVIVNATTGQSISVPISIADSDTLVIDCRPATRGVYLNGVQRMDLKASVGWIGCPPGANAFYMTCFTTESNSHCTVTLQPRWI